MEMTETIEGKGLAITGFVLAIVGLIFAPTIAVIVALSMASGAGSVAMMILWLALCMLSIGLSVAAMQKLAKTKGKQGLAIAGLVIGIVATVYSIILVFGLNTAASLIDGSSYQLKDFIETIDDSKNKINQRIIENIRNEDSTYFGKDSIFLDEEQIQ